ncbi:hypothetical protein B0H17DRAFT_1097737 [Mycena rosella]|uniref:Uncharacterized protein n=1 Tax=Mycena rosella TaxID=1033263 RepID=A0AAD7G513_MYCRO|nr:hypothetical protein B0H17DRAFT_1097737 [Mycena rosella]
MSSSRPHPHAPGVIYARPLPHPDVHLARRFSIPAPKSPQHSHLLSTRRLATFYSLLQD